MLEQNANLSMRYIDDQSRMLRDAFGKMEARLGEIDASVWPAFLDLIFSRWGYGRIRLILADLRGAFCSGRFTISC